MSIALADYALQAELQIGVNIISVNISHQTLKYQVKSDFLSYNSHKIIVIYKKVFWDMD